MHRADPPAADIEAAIARVLAAEAAADAVVDQSRREAQALIEAARASARRIGDRAGTRAQGLARKIEMHAAEQMAALPRHPTDMPQARPPDAAGIAAIVDAVAAELTGGAA